MMYTNYELFRHRTGDVWKLADGRYVIFDFNDSTHFGWTYSDGTGGGTRNPLGLAKLLRQNNATIVETGDNREFPTKQDSLIYLHNIIQGKMNTTKSCPFCGSNEVYPEYREETSTYTYECHNCLARGPESPGNTGAIMGGYKTALEMWNKRIDVEGQDE